MPETNATSTPAPGAQPSTRRPTIYEVFHPADFTEGDESAFAHALRLAAAAKGQVQLLHVGESEEHIRWGDFPRVRSTLIRWGLLPPQADHRDVSELGLGIVKVRRTGKDAAQEIIRYIDEHRPSLVVLATHQREGLDRWLHGSVAEPIARQSRTQTLFVPRNARGFVNPQTGQPRLKNILIPVDRSPSPRVAVEAACDLARILCCDQAHFTLLHAGKDSDMPRVEIPNELAWTQEKRSWEGEVVDHICTAAETDESDLIVMATRGRHGFLDAWRGSTTERVLRRARCPVLAVPV